MQWCRDCFFVFFCLLVLGCFCFGSFRQLAFLLKAMTSCLFFIVAIFGTVVMNYILPWKNTNTFQKMMYKNYWKLQFCDREKTTALWLYEGKWPWIFETTGCCHLSSILPAATRRLSLCKTDICPEAFFHLSCALFSQMYQIFYTWYLIGCQSIISNGKPGLDRYNIRLHM